MRSNFLLIIGGKTSQRGCCKISREYGMKLLFAAFKMIENTLLESINSGVQIVTERGVDKIKMIPQFGHLLDNSILVD